MAKEKSIQDYYEILYEKYPTVAKSDIKRILQYGWKSLYLHNSYGGDVLLQRRKLWLYFGSLTNNSVRWFSYYKRKMIIKLRVLYKRYKIQWDGYYYFALSKKQYQEYLNKKNKRGRPRKNFDFGKVLLYKIYDECNLAENGKQAIFKVPMMLDVGFTTYKEHFVTGDAQLVLVRDTLKLKDILISEYDYEFLKCKYR